MSDKMRWRYGDINLVVAAVDAETVIEVGDLLWLDVDDAKPASKLDLSKFSNPGQMQFADKFLGVAMQRSLRPLPGSTDSDDNTDPVRVATTGVFEFDCYSNTFEIGDLIGVDDGGRTLLLNQQVGSVVNSVDAVARVAKREPSATTSVLIDIRSTIMTGGIVGRG